MSLELYYLDVEFTDGMQITYPHNVSQDGGLISLDTVKCLMSQMHAHEMLKEDSIKL
jgi:hypothetical protein